MDKKIRGLHSSPGIYSKFTDIERIGINNKDRNIIKPTGGVISSGSGVTPSPKPEPVIPFEEEYLTITALEDDCCVYFSNFDTSYVTQSYSCTIEYSTDKKVWNEVESKYITFIPPSYVGDYTVKIKMPEPFFTLNKGEKLFFRGTNDRYCDGSESGSCNYMYSITCLFKQNYNMLTFDYNEYDSQTPYTPTPLFDVSGNIMSLIYGDDFIGKTVFKNPDNTFDGFFTYNIYLNSAENLILPAKKVGALCYGEMFQWCLSLLSAPELPATILGRCCYFDMFETCKNLISAPELPAATLTYECYYYMFSGCTSLVTAPELPATSLAQECYEYMFANCTSLIEAPVLPATTLANSCYYGMFRGCSGLTTTPELPATTLAPYCYAFMFNGCSGLTTAPELPATTLAGGCYQSMFYACKGITTAPALQATTLVQGCYYYMFTDCNKLNYIKCLATNISASYCTSNWVSNVSSTGTFVVPNSMQATWNSKGTGGSGKPNGWTYQDV